MAFNSRSLSPRFALAVASTFLFTAAAYAHESHGKPQHGGVVAEAGVFQTELVLKQSDVTIYLTEHGKDVSSNGATGKLTVLSDGKTQSLVLSPSTGNQLKATLAAPLKNGKFVAQIALQNRNVISVRFELK